MTPPLPPTEKTFHIVQAIFIRHGHHNYACWHCPFCDGVGDHYSAAVPEYFSVQCHTTREIFLVHNAEPREPEHTQ
jgi:hypothetical protein